MVTATFGSHSVRPYPPTPDFYPHYVAIFLTYSCTLLLVLSLAFRFPPWMVGSRSRSTSPPTGRRSWMWSTPTAFRLSITYWACTSLGLPRKAQVCRPRSRVHIQAEVRSQSPGDRRHPTSHAPARLSFPVLQVHGCISSYC